MEFHFSFSPKEELIVIDEHVYTHDIGALIQCVIDTDWIEIQNQVELWMKHEIPSLYWGKHIEKILVNVNCHPAIRNYLVKVSENGILAKEIQSISKTKEILRTMFETLVDEDKNEYAMCIYELFHEQFRQGTEGIIEKLDNMKWVSAAMQSILTDDLKKKFRMLYVTDDLSMLLYREVRFLCSNHFIIRKCINCRNFFWTQSTTKMYCSRAIPHRKATCSQYGPRRKRQLEKRPAYKLYWSQRNKIFAQAMRDENAQAFRRWVKAAAPYKELSEHGDITLEEMAHALNIIEGQIFPHPHYVKTDTVG